MIANHTASVWFFDGHEKGELHTVEVYLSREGAIANAAHYNDGEQPRIVFNRG